MKPVLIVFGTRHGTSRKIAGRLAARLVRRRVPVELVDAAHVPPGLDVDAHAAVFVVASVHAGKHLSEVITFARTHRAALERLPSVLVSVSLSAAIAADALGLPERRAAAQAELLHMFAAFVADTGWSPRQLEPVAGALTYRAYPFFLRQLMRVVAWRAGAPTDTSRDHELTDWKGVDRIAEAMVGRLVVPRPPVPKAPPRAEMSMSWN